ncbi:hypothetical protein IMZ08_17980 [Bacillus luteolus]|uniref:Uncharacterized protein n=1 Tax=Litchfieldia luteola TaxID=682179 RepID=A0ABR9QN51_9BACI|nr:hypothetical protein [Cytobacillus luteolus]MBE4909928.1 hypothetical protein [Cytobacillus luteolus]MBP1942516.1 hypothetical protein [Cytobacillus luteolus]
MKVAIRIMLSVILLIIAIGIIDTFVEKGILKFILIGVSVSVVAVFNDKQNLKLREK